MLGTKIIATASDNGGAGNTSEFSNAATVISLLLAAGGAASAGSLPAESAVASLTSGQLQPIVDAAIARLAVQGLTVAQVNQDLMYEALAVGVRRTSFAAAVDAAWNGG